MRRGATILSLFVGSEMVAAEDTRTGRLVEKGRGKAEEGSEAEKPKQCNKIGHAPAS